MTKRKKSRLVLLILLLILLLIQFLPVDRSIPESGPELDYLAMTAVPENIATLLKAACYDCHSYESSYPWYSYVAPIGGWIQGHIKHGRGNLNFSLWGEYSEEDRLKMLDEIAEEVEAKHMPLTSYTWLHQEARMTDEERMSLSEWFAK